MPFRSQNVWRRNFAESICIILLSVTLGDAAETLVVQLPGTRANPELVTINQGDTVVFAWGGPSGLIESYTGEWKSPVLQSGQTFSYTFTNPGTYVYRVRSGVYGNEFIYPGVIRAQPVRGSYPAIWITRPLDHFIVPSYAAIEAATTNSPQSVKAVYFYANNQVVGTATNAPYVVTVDLSSSLGTYAFTATVVDTRGQTNSSAPVWITFTNWDDKLFQPWRLPQGQTIFFVSGGGPWCIQWSGDLKTWNRGRLNGQQWGDSVVVDETTTNVIQRFYWIQYCL